jgi:HAD superfamily hydrolase (TIGR01509 family)
LTFDLVIFDCDGVLVDSEALDVEIVARLMDEQGVQMTPEDVVRLGQGMTDEDMWAKLESEFGLEITPTVRQRHWDLTLEAFRDVLRPIPGVERAVQSLVAAGMPICVASSGKLEKMNVTLAVTGLAGYFERHIFSATQVPHGKPAPDLFLFAAQSMGADPSHCVVIEDSRNGVLAGLAAGMTVFAYRPEGDAADFAALGAHPFENMARLPALLGVSPPKA